jgi:hypothetical protein
MGKYFLNDREVCDVEIEHGRSRDVVDSFVTRGTWYDTGEPLTDDELEELQNDNGDALCEDALEAGAWH